MKKINFYPVVTTLGLVLSLLVVLSSCIFDSKKKEDPPPPPPAPTYPTPQGGNVVGTWTFSQLDYQMNPPSDTLRLVVTSQTFGSSTLNAQNEWSMNVGAHATLAIQVNVPYLGWTTAADSTWSDTTYSWGTYTVNGSDLVMTSTGTETEPSFGSTETLPYTVRSDSLILYKTQEVGTYNLDVWWLFRRQTP
jgi:hypothetical protein